jgi:hypothetical protein
MQHAIDPPRYIDGPANIAFQILECRIVQQMLDVIPAPSNQIIERNNLMSFAQQALRQV